MEMFKTIDIRGLSFFSALQLASQEFDRIKKMGFWSLLLIKKEILQMPYPNGPKTRDIKFPISRTIPGWCVCSFTRVLE